MDTFYDFRPGLLPQSAVALGFFDGVHPGHQVVIRKAVEEARRLKVTSALVTFKDHPRTLTTGNHPPLLTSLNQRLELFGELGVETCLALSFTEALCRLSAEDYVTKVLVECLGAKSVSVGFNHHFGRNREGNPELLRVLGQDLGFAVHVAKGVMIDGCELSSSRIREAVSEGDLQLARRLLSRPYALEGCVVRGAGRGSSLGFPTANLKVADFQLLPHRGVYAGMVRLLDGSKRCAVINVGYQPTFAALEALQVEVHILDWKADLYDSRLVVELWYPLRAEMKFSGIEALQNQIAKDVSKAREMLAGGHYRAGQGEKRLLA